MREAISIALAVGLSLWATGAVDASDPVEAPVEESVEATTAPADARSEEQARARITDLLFSDDVDRIDFQVTTYEEATLLIHASVDRMLALGTPALEQPAAVAEKATEVIEALNTSVARGLGLTFQKGKQNLVVDSLTAAEELGEIVGETILIIHGHYGTAEVSYRDKASNLFGNVRLNVEDSESLLTRHLETVLYVKGSSVSERSRFLNQ